MQSKNEYEIEFKIISAARAQPPNEQLKIQSRKDLECGKGNMQLDGSLAYAPHADDQLNKKKSNGKILAPPFGNPKKKMEREKKTNGNAKRTKGNVNAFRLSCRSGFRSSDGRGRRTEVRERGWEEEREEE